MRTLDKIIFIIFSNIVLILSIVLCLMLFGWLSPTLVGGYIYLGLTGNLSSKIILGVCIVLILLAIKSIFFNSYSEDNKMGQGVLMENSEGKLLITKETIENIVSSVVKQSGKVEDSSIRITMSEENNINIYVYLVVHANTVIKELSAKLQTKIKEKIKEITDLEVKEVNIKIKNVAQKESVTK